MNSFLQLPVICLHISIYIYIYTHHAIYPHEEIFHGWDFSGHLGKDRRKEVGTRSSRIAERKQRLFWASPYDIKADFVIYLQ